MGREEDLEYFQGGWNIIEKAEVFWGRLDYFRGNQSTSEGARIFYRVGRNISEVNDNGGGDGEWPWWLSKDSRGPWESSLMLSFDPQGRSPPVQP